MALVTAAEVKLWVPQAVGNDDRIPDAIVQAHGLAEHYCRRWLELADRAETLSPPAGADSVALRGYPVVSVASVELAPLSSSPEPLAADQYLVDQEAGLVHFPFRVPGGPLSVRVTYRGGYTAETAPPALRRALFQLVAWLLETRGDVGFTQTAMDGVSLTREPLVDGVPESIARALDAFRSGGAGP